MKHLKMISFIDDNKRGKMTNKEIVEDAVNYVMIGNRFIIYPEANLVDDLGFDSLDKVELILELEDRFALSIDDKESDKMHTIQDIYDFFK